jgi:hypothetical protein
MKKEELKKILYEFRSSILNGWKEISPSDKTINFMRETRKEINKLNIEMSDVKVEFKHIISSLDDLKSCMKEININLEKGLEKKADKEEVIEIKKTVEELKKYKWQAAAVISVIVLAFTLLKDKIL